MYSLLQVCMCVCICVGAGGAEWCLQLFHSDPITQQCGHWLPLMRIFLLPITVLTVFNTCILKKYIICTEYLFQPNTRLNSCLHTDGCDFHLALNFCVRQHASKCHKWRRIENITHRHTHIVIEVPFFFKMSKTWACCLLSFLIDSLDLCGFPAKHHGILKS